jgi:hypothetical protein
LPQGSPKKIEFNLLPADLALQLADALARACKIPRRLEIEHAKPLARPTRRPQRLCATPAKVLAPLVQIPARDLELACHSRDALPRQHSSYRRELELSAEHSTLAFGHRPLLDNVSCSSVSLLGCTPKRRTSDSSSFFSVSLCL